MTKSIGIIIPIYNEEKCIKEFVISLQKIKLRNYEKYIYFIDDKSGDRTNQILKKIVNLNKNYFFVQNKKNLGQNKSLKKNLYFINNHSIYLTLDGYGQHPTDEIETLIERFFEKNLDLLHGKKIKETGGDTFLRRLASFIASIILSLWYLDKNINSTNFFFFNNKVKEIIPNLKTNNSLSVELIHKYQNIKSDYFRYIVKKRIDGKSKYNFFKRLNLLIGLMVDRFK